MVDHDLFDIKTFKLGLGCPSNITTNIVYICPVNYQNNNNTMRLSEIKRGELQISHN